MNEQLTQRIPACACPVCGAEPPKRIWTATANQTYGGGTLYVFSMKKRKFLGPPSVRTVPLVCTICGYVQLFVDIRDFCEDASTEAVE